MIKKLSIILYAGLSLALSFCSSKKGTEQAAEEKKAELEAFVEREFEYPIPTSFEVTKMLQDANASYVSDITNDPENVDQYVAEWQKAMNLGVYGADLSYSSTFNKQQQTVAFLEASKDLIDDLNISTAFNQTLVSRIESNLENKDSLILIITESFHDTYNYLNKSGDEKTSLLVVAGSVIEGLYITTKLIESSDYNAELMGVLAAQKDQVGSLTELMEEHDKDENVNKVLPFLRYVNLFYEQLGDNGEISVGQFEDVSSSITEMRNQIVG